MKEKRIILRELDLEWLVLTKPNCLSWMLLRHKTDDRFAERIENFTSKF